MNLLRVVSCAVFIVLCSVSSIVSADIMVYTETTTSHGHQWHSRTATSTATRTVVKVDYSREMNRSWHVAPVSAQERTHGPSWDQVIMLNSHATWWIKSAHGRRMKVTVPLHLYMASWDVRALEKELERLGVKVKSKPLPKPAPKPGAVIPG